MMQNLHSAMLKWQRRAEDRHKLGPWMVISQIAGNLRVSKDDARCALYPLIVAGRVEQFHFSNGIAYRAIAAQDGP
jgi:hypothetical protein